MGVNTLSIVGSGMEAWGSYEEGKAMEYGEKRNAAMNESEIANIEANSQWEIKKLRKETGTLMSRQGALYAKAGVRFSGSALKMMAETAANAEMDVVMLQHNKNVEVSRLRSDSEYRKMLGKNYKRAGTAKAVTTMTSSISKSLIANSKYGNTTKGTDTSVDTSKPSGGYDPTWGGRMQR